MEKTTKDQILEAIAAEIQIPPSYYEKAEARYSSLGRWFGRPEATTCKHDPKIYAQGSFRLGTIIRPLHAEESSDLDMGCRLEVGITKSSHSQNDLKTLVRDELEAYRKAQRIQHELEEKHRCWRCEYADEAAFHMDVVPSIPEEGTKRESIAEAMIKRGMAKDLALDVAHHSGNITDNQLPNYKQIHHDWRVSNSEGYAKWFESRIATAPKQMIKVAAMARAAAVVKLPAWKWKSPLQRALQILKRHRDSMFSRDPDVKPISIILTTLAGYAYRGEEDVHSALERILQDMHLYVYSTEPKVPNPVNPNEDFADKWDKPENAHLHLQKNFDQWLNAARRDFKNLDSINTEVDLQKFVEGKFGLRIPQNEIKKITPLFGSSYELPRVEIISQPARPWCE